MGISETKKQIVIDNYFKNACDVNTSIKEAFTKGFEVGLTKAVFPKDRYEAGLKAEMMIILSEIRAEIEGMYRVILKGTPKDDWAVRWNDCLDEVLQIIDKYTPGSETEIERSLSQDIIERAKRMYPRSVSHKGQLTNEQFCEIEKECDIDFYKLGRQNIAYTIRYKGDGN